MPAKSMCPECGQARRSAAHICIPSAVDKMKRRKEATKALQQE